jgi:multidrug efflux pump subunit AcrA (membrane-fusion protein)
MARQPVNTGTKQAGGKFRPGASGNPAGKPAGARHKVTRAVEALLEGQHEALTQKAIALALAGDGPALRLCLDRIAPPRKDSPVSFALPSVRTVADAVEASASLLAVVASGEVTPDEAGRVMALLTAHKGLVETGDLEARITALEKKG